MTNILLTVLTIAFCLFNVWMYTGTTHKYLLIMWKAFSIINMFVLFVYCFAYILQHP